MNNKKQEVIEIPLYVIDSMPKIQELEYELVFKLNLGARNSIITDETGNVVQIDGKPICYPKDAINDHNIIKFDPFFNRKLTNFLFKRYVYIYMSENPGVEIQSFSLVNDLFTHETFAVARTNRGDICSNRFSNETVCWIDLIYKMDNSQFPYKEFYDIDRTITYTRLEGSNK